MKSLDVEIANVGAAAGRRRATRRARTGQRDYLERRRQMESNYDQFISGLKPLRPHADRAGTADPARHAPVRRMRDGGPAGVSGGSQQLYPEVAGVGALRRRREARAADGLHRERSPRSFRSRICRRSSSIWRCRKATSTRSPVGPPTRWGFAKGMWQFIPETAPAVRAEDRTAGGVSQGRTRSTIGTSGRRRPWPRPATSRTSIPPTRRRQGCW